MSQRNAVMLVLVAAQLAAAVIVGWVAEDGEPTILLAIYVGLTFSQTSLLGIWGGFSPQHWLLRICGLAVGIAFLGPAFDWGLRSDLQRWPDIDLVIWLLVGLCTLVTAGVMLAVRQWAGVRLVHGPSPAAGDDLGRREGLQFSIRHLIVLTFMVACLMAVGRWLQPGFSGVGELAHLGTLGVCFVAVGLAAPWATLGLRRPLWRSGVVLGLAAVTGLLPNLLANYWPVYFWMIVMVSEAAFVLASLLVVRNCGYRLLRLATAAGLRPKAQTPSGEQRWI